MEKLKPEEEYHDEPKQVIDTSKMSEGQRRALELAESSRDKSSLKKSFAGQLFMGNPDFSSIYPFPEQSDEDKAKGDKFLEKLQHIIDNDVDADAIDREGEIPQHVMDKLAMIGAFAIKVPKEYGGRGLSQMNYSRAAMRLGAKCGNLTALVSAHQSIGVPQPLLMFGTKEQKEKYLPRFGKGEISAFALTEENVGSDPSKLVTEAMPTEDGKHFIINGEKLWCTNGVKAGVIVVMAKTPAKTVNGKERQQVTAFIVDMDTPGIDVAHRCRFMGLKALYNGVIKFKDVKVPRENIILGEGKGLKVALSTLNTGRLTLPAACVGLSKECISILKKWCTERRQWGANIGKHAAIAEKIARISAQTFATEAMVKLTSALVDGKKSDIRLEAAMSKMWGTEKAWKIVDETMQIRGGRGYETADSLKARGKEPIAIERFMRDCRINMIFEGSSEIMRLFIAREALDPHLKVAGMAMNTKAPIGARLLSAMKAGLFYMKWYPSLWMPSFGGVPSDMNPDMAVHLKYVKKTSKKLARRLFHAMARFGPKLEKQQPLLARFVEIGAELFVLTASTLRAQHLLNNAKDENERIRLHQMIDYIAAESKLVINERFRGINNNTDSVGYNLAQNILKENHAWFENK